jgi:hypothetical protein
MAKTKRKLTASQKAAKKRRKLEFMTIFVRGKMKRIRRPLLIDGLDPEEFIRRNADPLWLHQNEMWEYIDESNSLDDTFDPIVFDERPLLYPDG